MASHRKSKTRRCGQCSQLGRWRLLELMWRLDGDGGWHWLASFLCASCRSALLQLIDDIAGGRNVRLVLDDTAGVEVEAAAAARH